MAAASVPAHGHRASGRHDVRLGAGPRRRGPRRGARRRRHRGTAGDLRVAALLDARATSALAAHLAGLGAPLDWLRHGTSLEDRYIAIVGDQAVGRDNGPPQSAGSESEVSALSAQSRAEVRRCGAASRSS